MVPVIIEFDAISVNKFVNESKQYFPRGNASSDTNQMTQKRFLSPFSCCAVSFLARNWYMPDCTLWFSRFISFLSTTRVQKVRLTMVFRFELSSDQEIEVQNRFLRSKVFWLWVNGRILRVCTLEFRIFQVKSLTIVLKSLPNAKIPNKILYPHRFESRWSRSKA